MDVLVTHAAFLARPPEACSEGRAPSGEARVGRASAGTTVRAASRDVESSSALKTPLGSHHLSEWGRPGFPQTSENPASRRDASRERTYPTPRREGRPGGGHALHLMKHEEGRMPQTMVIPGEVS